MGYITLLIAIYRVPELWVKDDPHYLNSILIYLVVLLVFLLVIFNLGLDSLEYFRLPRIGVVSITTILIAAIFVSPRFWSGQSELKPLNIAIPGIIYLMGIGFSEEVFSRGLIFGKLRHYGLHKAMIASSVVFGLLHINVYAGYGWDLWLAYDHVISAGAFGYLACAVMIATRSIWVSSIFHTLFNWHIVFGKEIEDSEMGGYPEYSLWENLTSPWFELLLYLPVALFVMRLNRGDSPKWIKKLHGLRKLTFTNH